MVTLRIQYYQASAATRARLPQLAEARALAESEHIGEVIEQVELLIRIVLRFGNPSALTAEISSFVRITCTHKSTANW